MKDFYLDRIKAWECHEDCYLDLSTTVAIQVSFFQQGNIYIGVLLLVSLIALSYALLSISMLKKVPFVRILAVLTVKIFIPI